MHHVHASANFSPLKPRKVRPRKSCDSSGGKLHIPLCSTLLRSTLSLYENIALDQAAVSSGRKHRLGSLCYILAMEESRRRQLHSCDPCRKGKRGCDAPVGEFCPPNYCQILTSRFRRTERTMDLIPALIANDGRRSARSTGSPQSMPSPREVGEEQSRQSPALQVQLTLAVSLQL